MPVFPGTGLDNEGFGGFLQQAPAHDFHFQDQRFDVAGEHDVATATQHKLRCGAPFGVGQQLMHVRFAGNAHQRVGPGNDMEGIKSLERHVFLD